MNNFYSVSRNRADLRFHVPFSRKVCVLTPNGRFFKPGFDFVIKKSIVIKCSNVQFFPKENSNIDEKPAKPKRKPEFVNSGKNGQSNYRKNDYKKVGREWDLPSDNMRFGSTFILGNDGDTQTRENKEINAIHKNAGKGEGDANKLCIAQIIGSGKAKQMDKCRTVYRKLITSAEGPSIRAVNDMIDAYGRSGEVEQAEEAFNDISKYNLSPDVYSYTGLMLAYCNSNRLAEAEAILDRMKTCGVKADSVIVGILLNAHAQRGDVEAINRIFNEMKSEVELDSGWFVSKMMALRRKKRTGLAIRVAKEMKICGVEPNVIALNLIVDLYGEKKCIREAERRFSMINKSGISPDTSSYNCLIGSYVAKGDIQQAMETFDCMKQEKLHPDIYTYNTLLSAHAKIGKIKECLHLMELMKMDGIQPNAATRTVIIRGLCKAGSFEQASAEFERLLDRDESLRCVELFNALISEYSKLGLVNNAFAVYNRMVDMGIKPSINTINCLINCYSILGDEKSAYQLLQAIPSLGLSPDVVSYTTVMKAFIQSGKLSEVQEVYNLMVHGGIKPDRRSKDMLRRSKRYLKSNKLPPVAVYGHGKRKTLVIK